MYNTIKHCQTLLACLLDGFCETNAVEHKVVNYTPPASVRLYLNRDAVLEDIPKQKLDMMPGFSLTWYYSGMEVEPMIKYNFTATRGFVRNCSNRRFKDNIYYHLLNIYQTYFE